MPANPKVPNGPIPGENYTSNTRNYPWHRPPEITDVEKGIEAAIKQLSTRTGAFGLLTSLQTGVTIVQAADMLVTSGIGKGKWSPDLAILLAGPVARMMEIMAKDAGITFALGLDDDPIPTAGYLKRKVEITSGVANQAAEALQANADAIKPPVEENSMGFMNKSDILGSLESEME
jgi:hypothetical protein